MPVRKLVGSAVGMLSLCLFVGNAYAIGLGNLTVHSKLDEPFEGTIELTSTTPADLANLTAQFGSSEEFARTGVRQLGSASDLNLELVSSGNRVQIRVTSEQAVTDPFMQFLISLKWPSGKVVREYTALIDPREYGITQPTIATVPATPTPSQPATETAAADASAKAVDNAGDKVIVKRGDTVWSIVSRLRLPAGADEYQMAMALLRTNPAAFPNNNFKSLDAGTVLTVPNAADVTRISKSKAAAEFAALSDAIVESPAKTTVATKVEQKTQLAATTAVSPSSGNNYGPVKEGETLWSIASRLPLPGGADAFQMAVALLQVNPSAFSDNTINSLNSGSVLTIPGIEDLQRVTDQQVSQAFGTPYSGPKISSSVPAAETQTEIAATPTAESTVTQEVDVAEMQPETEPASTTEQYEQAETTPQDENQDENIEALVQRITELEESLAPMEDDNQLLRERIAELEKEIEEKNKSAQEVVENMISDLGEESVTVDPQSDSISAESTAASDAGDVQETAEMATSSDEPASSPTETQAEPTAGQVAEDASQEVAATQVAQNLTSDTVDGDENVSAKTRVTAEASTSWWDRFLPGNPLGGLDIRQMGVLAGGVALIGLGTMLFLRRRRMATDDVDEYIPEPAMEVPSVTQRSASLPDSTDLPDPSVDMDTQQAGEERVTDGRIDPIAEAEVYVAYGREHEAEQVLRDALTENPNQPEVQLKLLEVYKRSHNTSAFTALAAELKTQWASTEPELWDRVVAQGQDLLPGNALFESADTEVPVDAIASFEEETTMVSAEEPDTPAQDHIAVTKSSLELPNKDIGIGSNVTDATAKAASTVDDEFTVAFDSDGSEPKLAERGNETVAEAVEEAKSEINHEVSDRVQSAAEGVAEKADSVANDSLSDALDAVQRSGVSVQSASDPVEQADGLLADRAVQAAAPAGVAMTAASAQFDDEPSLSELSESIKSKNQEESASNAGDSATNTSELSIANKPSLGDDTVEETEQTPTLDIADLEGDDLSASLDSLAAEASSTIQPRETSAALTDDESSVGLDLSTDDLNIEDITSANTETQSQPAAVQSTPSGGAGDEDSLQWDAIGTKLDLAKAYIDMGDASSASGLIEEAMREGNEQQRAQAAALATQLPSS